MFISKVKFKEIIAKSIYETARACGRNLTNKQKQEIYRKLQMRQKEKSHKEAKREISQTRKSKKSIASSKWGKKMKIDTFLYQQKCKNRIEEKEAFKWFGIIARAFIWL